MVGLAAKILTLKGALDEQPKEFLRTFPTTTKGLLELRDWLEDNQCTHVAIESTGIYWRPVFHILEDVVTVLLVNAYHMKQVPGRKTDLKDAHNRGITPPRLQAAIVYFQRA